MRMQAAYITGLGAPDVIRIGDLPVPTPGPTDVLVRVDAVAVNQVDTYIRSGRWSTPTPFPFVVGRDLVGSVVTADTAGMFGAGDRVWSNSLGHAGRQGACAEYAVVPAERLYPLPDDVDPIAAVASFHPAATAFLALHRRARIRAGDAVLVGGAAGSVGASATRLATAAGATVVATARPADHDRCRRLGAAAVFDYRAANIGELVRSAAPGGIDLWWDTSGHSQLNSIAPLMRPGGTVMVTAGRDAQPPTPLWPLYTNDLSVIGFVISRASAADLADAASALNRHLAAGGLGIEVAHVLPLADTARAHQLVEDGVRGRVVVTPG
jgi:NADPH:quinone reductase-like Zn-dependent oxidoreductase